MVSATSVEMTGGLDTAARSRISGDFAAGAQTSVNPPPIRGRGQSDGVSVSGMQSFEVQRAWARTYEASLEPDRKAVVTDPRGSGCISPGKHSWVESSEAGNSKANEVAQASQAAGQTEIRAHSHMATGKNPEASYPANASAMKLNGLCLIQGSQRSTTRNQQPSADAATPGTRYSSETKAIIALLALRTAQKPADVAYEAPEKAVEQRGQQWPMADPSADLPLPAPAVSKVVREDSARAVPSTILGACNAVAHNLGKSPCAGATGSTVAPRAAAVSLQVSELVTPRPRSSEIQAKRVFVTTGDGARNGVETTNTGADGSAASESAAVASPQPSHSMIPIGMVRPQDGVAGFIDLAAISNPRVQMPALTDGPQPASHQTELLREEPQGTIDGSHRPEDAQFRQMPKEGVEENPLVAKMKPQSTDQVRLVPFADTTGTPTTKAPTFAAKWILDGGEGETMHSLQTRASGSVQPGGATVSRQDSLVGSDKRLTVDTRPVTRVESADAGEVLVQITKQTAHPVDALLHRPAVPSAQTAGNEPDQREISVESQILFDNKKFSNADGAPSGRPGEDRAGAPGVYPSTPPQANATQLGQTAGGKSLGHSLEDANMKSTTLQIKSGRAESRDVPTPVLSQNTVTLGSTGGEAKIRTAKSFPSHGAHGESTPSAVPDAKQSSAVWGGVLTFDGRPNTAPHNSRAIDARPEHAFETFTAMDSGPMRTVYAPAQQFQRGISVGYQDSRLGYVEVRAHQDLVGIHASLMAPTQNSSASLEGELKQLRGWLAERQTPVESLQVSAQSNPGNSQAGHSNGNAYRTASETTGGALSENTVMTAIAKKDSETFGIDPLRLRPGSHFSIMV